MSVINQKDYLKKYLKIGKGSGEKKKKKKVEKTFSKGLKVIDDDIDTSLSREIQDDLDAANEDAPQIVAIIDERPPSLRIDDQTKNNLWQPIGASSNTIAFQNFKIPGIKLNINKEQTLDKRKDKYGKYSQSVHVNKNNYSPPRTKDYSPGFSPSRKNRDDQFPPRTRDQSPGIKSDDYSPPRKGRNNDQSSLTIGNYSSPPSRRKQDQSPQRKQDDYSPPRRGKQDQSPQRRQDDYPPPRRGKQDQSPQRRQDDYSPPRRGKQDQSPQRRQDDYSPPRRGEQDQSPQRKQDDYSPPRRGKQDQSPQRKQDNYSPTRKRRNSDQSPPRKGKTSVPSPPRRRRDRSSSRKWNDSSPTRRKGKPIDESPPRRKLNDDNSPPKKEKISDQSPPRQRRNQSPHRKTKDDQSPRRKNKKSRWEERDVSPSASQKPEITMSGKKSGLQTAKNLTEDIIRLQKEEEEIFKTMSADVSGVNAATIVRKKKKEDDVDLEKEKREKELKEKYCEWGKGVKQVQDEHEKMAEQFKEMNKPLARYANDEDLEKYLKEQERDGDPMLAYIRKKKKKVAVERGVPEKPTYMGDFMPNRFGIRPGYRWDGVDRSNGYEKKWFQVQNSKKAMQEEALLWSQEDM